MGVIETHKRTRHTGLGGCVSECVFTSKNPTGENNKCNDCQPCCTVLPRSAHPFLLPRSHREQVQSLLAQVFRWRLSVGKLSCLHGSGEGCVGFELFLPESSPSGHWTSCWHPGPGSTTGVTLELEVPWHDHLHSESQPPSPSSPLPGGSTLKFSSEAPFFSPQHLHGVPADFQFALTLHVPHWVPSCHMAAEGHLWELSWAPVCQKPTQHSVFSFCYGHLLSTPVPLQGRLLYPESGRMQLLSSSLNLLLSLLPFFPCFLCPPW